MHINAIDNSAATSQKTLRRYICALLGCYAVYRREFLTDESEQFIGPIFTCQCIFLDFLILKMGPIGCSETSARNSHYTLRNIPE